jgi:peptidoglycan/xylan/chitin deacetylase (PgdA/CDA1 family)
MIAPRGVPVLTYHSVSPEPDWLPWAEEIAVHPDTLRAHLEALRAMGCRIVSTRTLTEARLRGERLPGRPVVLHFDDGYFDNWLHAAPILRDYGAPATFFASLDFIAPGGALRALGAAAHGYMNWTELAALDADPLFEVEPHGIDHGRVPVSQRVVARLTAQNWRGLAWVQWAAMPGPKHDWYLAETPPAVPLGAPVPESEGALAAAALGESEAQYRARVEDHLTRCAGTWRARLGRSPFTFCWPENRVSPAAREIAASLGYGATTGGAWRNTKAEPAAIVSRIHAGDRALGVRWAPAEKLRMRAMIGLFEGNHYWYLIAGPMDLARRLVTAARRRFPGLAKHAPFVPSRDSRKTPPSPSVTT